MSKPGRWSRYGASQVGGVSQEDGLGMEQARRMELV